jgi:hypothetical protein
VLKLRDIIARCLLLACALVAALVLAACGDEDPSSDAAGGPDPATMVPGDAPIVFQATVKPEGDQRDGVEGALSKLLATDDPGAKIVEGLDSSLSEDGLSYSEDIEPWLGPRAAGFITTFTQDSADGAGVFAVTDTEAAQDFLGKAEQTGSETFRDSTYDGNDYQVGSDDTAVGIVGDFMVVGTEQGFKDAVDASSAGSFSENTEAQDALADADADGGLFSAYADTTTLVDAIKRSGSFPPEVLKQFDEQIGQYGEGPVVIAGSATDDSISFDTSAPAGPDSKTAGETVSSLPSDSWFAFGGDFGSQFDQFTTGLKSGIEQSAPPGVSPEQVLGKLRNQIGIDLERDLGWIGNVSGFVEGTSVFGLGGGLVLEATDEDAATQTLDNLQQALGRSKDVQVTPRPGGGTGFDLQVNGAPIGAEVALEDGKVVGAVGAATVDDVLSPSETLADSDAFSSAQDALGDSIDPSFYLDFAPILDLVQSTGQATTDPSYQAALPYLSALDYLIGGSGIDGDRVNGSLVLGLQEPTSTSGSEAASLIP